MFGFSPFGYLPFGDDGASGGSAQDLVGFGDQAFSSASILEASRALLSTGAIAFNSNSELLPQRGFSSVGVIAFDGTVGLSPVRGFVTSAPIQFGDAATLNLQGLVALAGTGAWTFSSIVSLSVTLRFGSAASAAFGSGAVLSTGTSGWSEIALLPATWTDQSRSAVWTVQQPPSSAWQIN